MHSVHLNITIDHNSITLTVWVKYGNLYHNSLKRTSLYSTKSEYCNRRLQTWNVRSICTLIKNYKVNFVLRSSLHINISLKCGYLHILKMKTMCYTRVFITTSLTTAPRCNCVTWVTTAQISASAGKIDGHSCLLIFLVNIGLKWKIYLV